MTPSLLLLTFLLFLFQFYTKHLHNTADLDPNMGMEHAECIAKRLYEDPLEAPAVIYTSPFIRCAHTAQLIALATPHHAHTTTTTTTTAVTFMPVVRVEQGLTEWLIPDLLLLNTMQEHDRHLPRLAEELAETYGTIDPSYRSLVNPCQRVMHKNDHQQQQQSSSSSLSSEESPKQQQQQQHAPEQSMRQQQQQQQAPPMTMVDHDHANGHYHFEREQNFLQ